MHIKFLNSEKNRAIISSSLLFLLAILFSLATLFSMLDFGTQGNGLYRMGSMLKSVYGTSSILIPAYFFTAGAFCLASKWSVQRAVCLLVSFLPFFTIVVTEKWSRHIALEELAPVAAVKITILVVIATLLIVAEYLLALVFAGYVQKRFFNKENSGNSTPKDEALEKKSAEKKEPHAEQPKSVETERVSLPQKEQNVAQLPDGLEVAEEDAMDEDIEDFTDIDKTEFVEPQAAPDFFEEAQKSAPEEHEDDTLLGKVKLGAKKILKKAREKGEVIVSLFAKDEEEAPKETVNIDDFYAEAPHTVIVEDYELKDSDSSAGENVVHSDSRLILAQEKAESAKADENVAEESAKFAKETETFEAKTETLAEKSAEEKISVSANAQAEETVAKEAEMPSMQTDQAEAPCAQEDTFAEKAQLEVEDSAPEETDIEMVEDAGASLSDFIKEPLLSKSRSATLNAAPLGTGVLDTGALGTIFAKMDEDIKAQVEQSPEFQTEPMQPSSPVHQIDDSLIEENVEEGEDIIDQEIPEELTEAEIRGEDDFEMQAEEVEDGEEVLEEESPKEMQSVQESVPLKTAVVTTKEGTRPIELHIKKAHGPYKIFTYRLCR